MPNLPSSRRAFGTPFKSNVSRLMSRILVLIALACLASPAAAQSDGSQFTIMAGFKLGKLTLGQITKSLGPSKLIESGDGGEYEAKICYRAPTGLVHFLSGEMGRPDHTLVGFGVSIDDETQPCPTFPTDHVPKTLNLAGLRLGQSRAEFSRAVKQKIEWNGNIGRTFFESKRPMTPTELDKLYPDFKAATLARQEQNYFDVGVSVIGTFSGDKMTGFKVWKVETF